MHFESSLNHHPCHPGLWKIVLHKIGPWWTSALKQNFQRIFLRWLPNVPRDGTLQALGRLNGIWDFLLLTSVYLWYTCIISYLCCDVIKVGRLFLCLRGQVRITFIL